MKRAEIVSGGVILITVAVILTGCDQDFSIRRMLAGIPDDFTESGDHVRVTPANKPSAKKDGKEASLEFFQAPTAQNPFSGAELRIKRALVEGNPAYREFLLPKIVLQSRSPYQMALQVNLGGAASEIRAIVPGGDFYIGLLPSFNMDWVGGIEDGGAVNMDIRADGRWSKLRADDVSSRGRFSASSPSHIPRKHLNPLLASALEPSSEGLPGVGLAKRGGALMWMENAHYGLSMRGWKSEKENMRNGWLRVRPVEKILDGNGVTATEFAVLWASMAVRDGIPCWFVFLNEEVFLMFGALPPSQESYVMSPTIFLDKGDKDDFYSLSERSRQSYVEILTKGAEPQYLSGEDRKFFYDLPARKKVTGGKATKEEPKNPFEP
jgi:hypothetical protein